ncbi:MAG TPA: Gfo/Idh/MocA family oxidoreductase [Saprospiraceae bacterium]|nr:Gfo/Idh/MocA family oxidoreductase [Saprospiraceae bacterium]
MSIDRRDFLQNAAMAVGLLPFGMSGFKEIKVKANPLPEFASPRIKMGIIGINHGHIYSMANAVIKGGAELVSFYAQEDDLAIAFLKRFPNAKRVKEEKEVLEDPSIQLILSAAIPNERAPIAMRAMLHGKDVMVDKPGITDLNQLKKLRQIQKKTGKIFSVSYSERFENQASEKAGELVKAGAIGKVIQTIGLGPHRRSASSRPTWFFDKKYFGGIITDIASHQFDQFLYYTGSTKGEILGSQVGNWNNKQYPQFEDFGDVIVRGDHGTGYIRVDWFTPGGVKPFGDGRLFILGTEGYIELRKYTDIANKEKGSNLYLVNQKEALYMDCSDVNLTYGHNLVDDVLNRTDTAMTQAHSFLAMELAIKAQKMAKWIDAV